MRLEIFLTFSQGSGAFEALLRPMLSRKTIYTNHIFFLIYVIGCYQIVLNVRIDITEVVARRFPVTKSVFKYLAKFTIKDLLVGLQITTGEG